MNPSNGPSGGAPGAPDTPSVKAFAVGDTHGWVIEPASPRRDWMDAIPNGFAYRCLPLVIGNQSGWVIRCPAAFTAEWSGAPDLHATAITLDAGSERYKPVILSHFGHGILTFSLPWLFRTSPGLGLLVRGPTNAPKPGIAPLDAFVETDWSPYTFTMNWKILHARAPVRFERGEAIAQVLPYSMDLAERCAFSIAPIDADPKTRAAFEAWRASRNTFNARPDRTAEEWQKGYMRGQTPDGSAATNHRTNLKLARPEPPSGAGD